MGMRSAAAGDQAAAFLAFYDDALPQVYGYLAKRCGPATLAEELRGESKTENWYIAHTAAGAQLIGNHLFKRLGKTPQRVQ